MTGCRNNTARYFCFLLSILVLWATQGICAKKKPPLHPVNLNTASSAELQQVPGIGPATADKILQARKSYGRFKSVNELQSIRGIGPKKLEKMRPYLTVGSAAPTKKSTTPPAQAKAPPAKNAPGKPALPAKTARSTASEEEEEP